MNEKIKRLIGDILTAVFAGLIVGVAYYFFQNSNGFAPGGVGGLATITYHLLQGRGIEFSWAILMILFKKFLVKLNNYFLLKMPLL